MSAADGTLVLIFGATDLSALTLVAGTTVTVTPGAFAVPSGPQQLAVVLRRGDQFVPLATFPLRIRFAGGFTTSEFVGASSGSMPTLTATGTGAAPTLICLRLRTSDGVRRCTLENGVGPLVSIPPATLQSISGTQTQTLRLSLAGTTETLSLVVRAP